MIQTKEYLKPNLECIEFDEDVILTSGGCEDDDCPGFNPHPSNNLNMGVPSVSSN